MECLSINLSLTNRCNQHCLFCPYHGIVADPAIPTDLPWEHLQRILSDLSVEYSPTVKLAGAGEPTLYPQFIPLLSTLKTYGFPVRLITNGLRLGEFARDLRGINELVVSYHGPGHDRIVQRLGALNQVMEGILRFQELNTGVDRTRVIIHMVLTESNYREIPEVARTANALGCTPRFQHLKMLPGCSSYVLKNADLLQELLEETIIAYPQTLIEPVMDASETARYYAEGSYIRGSFCWRITSDITIQETGRVPTCDGSSLGDISSDNILSIINGKHRRLFIESVNSNGVLPPYCDRCCYDSKERITRYCSAGES